MVKAMVGESFLKTVLVQNTFRWQVPLWFQDGDGYLESVGGANLVCSHKIKSNGGQSLFPVGSSPPEPETRDSFCSPGPRPAAGGGHKQLSLEFASRRWRVPRRNLISLFDGAQSQMLPVGARLAHFADIWARNCTDSWGKNHGHPRPFLEVPQYTPSRSLCPPKFQSRSRKRLSYFNTFSLSKYSKQQHRSPPRRGPQDFIPPYSWYARWLVAPSHQLKETELFYSLRKIKNGVHSHDHSNHTAGRLDALSRSTGRIPPHSNLSRLPEVPEVCSRSDTFTVYQLTLWSVHVSKDLHKSPHRHTSPAQGAGTLSPPLPGRCPTAGQGSGTITVTQGDPHLHFAEIWVDHQLQEKQRKRR